MDLKDLGSQYIRAAEQLRERAGKLAHCGVKGTGAAELSVRINELRRIAVRLAKYGRYLSEYYETEGKKNE